MQGLKAPTLGDHSSTITSVWEVDVVQALSKKEHNACIKWHQNVQGEWKFTWVELPIRSFFTLSPCSSPQYRPPMTYPQSQNELRPYCHNVNDFTSCMRSIDSVYGIIRTKEIIHISCNITNFNQHTFAKAAEMCR